MGAAAAPAPAAAIAITGALEQQHLASSKFLNAWVSISNCKAVSNFDYSLVEQVQCQEVKYAVRQVAAEVTNKGRGKHSNRYRAFYVAAVTKDC